MNSFIRLVRRYSVALFCTLTVLLSLASYFTPIPRAALPFVFALTPTVVALALAAISEGTSGTRALLGQLTRWRVSLRWIVGVLALAFVMRLAVGVLGQAMGLIPAVPLQPQNWTQALALGLIFLVAAVLEELGWRGFALTRLLARRSPAFAGLALGIPWGVMHIVLHFPGMWAEGLPWLPTVVQLVALSMIITWLFVRSGRSLLVVIVFHAAQSFFGFLNEGLTPLHVTWLMTLVWSGTAALALVDMVALWRVRKPLAPAS